MAIDLELAACIFSNTTQEPGFNPYLHQLSNRLERKEPVVNAVSAGVSSKLRLCRKISMEIPASVTVNKLCREDINGEEIFPDFRSHHTFAGTTPHSSRPNLYIGHCIAFERCPGSCRVNSKSDRVRVQIKGRTVEVVRP